MSTKRDILGREAFVKNIFNVMVRSSEHKTSLSFAIDGAWGTGKSFVLDMLAKRLCVEQSEETQNDRFMVFRYNSWEYDYYKEPIIAIVAAIQDSLVEQNLACKLEKAKNQALITAVATFESIAKQLAKNKLGVDITEVIDSFETENSLDDTMSGVKKAIKAIRKSLSDISEHMTIVIMIDELDRCLPEYAIRILNRCNHMFEGLNNVQLVYSINSKQLEHSIKMIFGEKIDTANYLKKFYDGTFKLDSGEVDEGLIAKYRDYFNLFDIVDDEGLKRDIVPFVSSLNQDVRSIEKTMEKIQLAHRMLQSDENDPSLLLFEIVSAFSLRVVQEEKRMGMELVLDNNQVVLAPSAQKTEYIAPLIRKWTCAGISQNAFLSRDLYNRWAHVSCTVYGKLTYCLNSIFNHTNRDRIAEDDSIEGLCEICKEFWQLYLLME